jgi:hypothetical protein
MGNSVNALAASKTIVYVGGVSVNAGGKPSLSEGLYG